MSGFDFYLLQAMLIMIIIKHCDDWSESAIYIILAHLMATIGVALERMLK